MATIKSRYTKKYPAIDASKDTTSTMSNGGYILAPQSAVGVIVAQRCIARAPSSRIYYVALATAHPAKVSHAVGLALKEIPGFEFKNVLPEQFERRDGSPERVTEFKKSNDLEGIRKLVRERVHWPA